MSTSTNRHRSRGILTAIVAAAGAAFVVSAFGAAPIASAKPLTQAKNNEFWACVQNAEFISVPGHNDSAVWKSCCESVGGIYTETPNARTCYLPDSPTRSTPPAGAVAVGHGPGPDTSRI